MNSPRGVEKFAQNIPAPLRRVLEHRAQFPSQLIAFIGFGSHGQLKTPSDIILCGAGKTTSSNNPGSSPISSLHNRKQKTND
jgi:hypothetical protein